jgi:DNA-binding response OmpR family regulator
MTRHKLAGTRVLVVEDEYYLADDVRTTLTDIGADVLGPLPSVSEAQAFINANAAIDCVLLDINLGGELAFDVADTLRERNIPFAFLTGYDRQALPGRFLKVQRLEKPANAEQLIVLISGLRIAQ